MLKGIQRGGVGIRRVETYPSDPRYTSGNTVRVLRRGVGVRTEDDFEKYFLRREEGRESKGDAIDAPGSR